MKEDIQNFQSKTIEPELERSTCRFWRKRRNILVMMAFLGFYTVFAIRTNMTVTMITFTGYNQSIVYENHTESNQLFPWSTAEQNYIASSFFYGYISTQIFGGYIAEKYSSKYVFSLAILATSILTLITPTIIMRFNEFYVYMTIHFLIGLFEGVTFPSMQGLWTKWSPPLETTRVLSIACSGSFVGTIIAMILPGMLPVVFGWQSSFYIFGVTGCIWFIVWTVVIAPSPETDKHITKDELRFIKQSLSTINNNNNIEGKLKYPWKIIFQSRPVWAMLIAAFCYSWGFYTLTAYLPIYLINSAVTSSFDMHFIGYMLAASYFTKLVFVIFVGCLTDLIRKKRWLTTTQIRRYINCSAFFIAASILISSLYIMNSIVSLICIILTIGIAGCSLCGHLMNPLDLAPQYSGVLMGILNTCGVIPAMIAPFLTALIIQHLALDGQKITFYIVAIFYLTGSIMYWCWSSSELQNWAKQ